MAITDHSKNLAFANGLDDKRAVEHIQRIRAAGEKMEGITSLPASKSIFWRTARSIFPIPCWRRWIW